MRIAALIVTYNRRAALEHSLEQVRIAGFDSIIVVDNASSDGSGAWLGTQQDIELVALPENTGGAGGFEVGVDHAVAIGADWVVLFDDDAWPAEGAVARLRESLPQLSADVGAISAAVRYPDGRICEMNRQGRNPFWNPGIFVRALFGGRGGFHLSDADFSPERAPCEVDNASFVGFVLRAAAVKTTGLPEGGLFIYGDDVLYSLRLRRAGWRILMDPSVAFVHDCGTMGDGYVYRPLWKVFYHCRNGVEIARVAAGPVVFPLALGYYTLLWARRGMACPRPHRATYFRLMAMGLWDGLRKKRGRKDLAHKIGSVSC